MRVDFYQLGDGGAESVLAAIATRLIDSEQRLVIVSDEAHLARLDRMLWDHGPSSFLPHGIEGGADDTRQPILLSTGTDAPNGARNLAIADGEWREAALTYDRAFYLFDAATIDGARLAWKLLSGRDGVERHYWANENGSWTQRG